MTASDVGGAPAPPPPTTHDVVDGAKVDGVFARLRRDRLAVFGVVLLVLVVVAAAAAPLITAINGRNPYDPDSAALSSTNGAARGALGGVSGAHWFGVEPQSGLDLFSLVIYGARTALLVGVAATAVEVVIGTLAGAAAALFGGWVDRIVSRVIEVVLGFPSLIFMIAVSAFVPSWLPKPVLVVLVIGIFNWGSTARIVRAQCLSLQQRNFIAASQAMGASRRHVFAAQLLPNLAATLIVLTATRIPLNIGYEAALSFLGVGVPAPTPSWGRTISTAVRYIATDPWYLLFPAGALFIVTYALNVIGDGLRDALDPRLVRRS